MLVRGLQTSFYLVMSDDDDNARFVSLQKRTSAFFPSSTIDVNPEDTHKNSKVNTT